jgi:Xaa-Pro dipeptidase
MNSVPEFLHEGIYEYEIAAEIDYLLQKNGADKSAFETISSFGKNTAEPHYSHGDTKLKLGNFALFDFGANFRKYNSDITRTFVFGKPNDKQKEMYETVFTAQKIGFNLIKPGVKAKMVHEAVNSYIDSSKFKGCFIHSTGHSLGLAVHDGKAGLSADCDVELKENMVFTVEPGIYIPGFGGVRIEDDVLIKRNGIDILTESPRAFIEI